MNDAHSRLLSKAGAAPLIGRIQWPVLALIVLVLLGAGVGFALWSRHPAEAQTPAQTQTDGKVSKRGGGAAGRGAETIPVAVGTVVKRDLEVTENMLGTVTPLTTVTVLAQVSGQITQVDFVEGQNVRKGDLLVQIDSRPYEAVLVQAEGQLAKDEAALEEARMDLKRYQDLVEKKSIQRQQYEDQKWIVLQDEGAVRVDQGQVDAAKVNLGFCRITSPTDGRVGLRLVDPGNVIQSGSGTTSLAVITRMQPMTVIFALPEDDLPGVLTRQRGGAKLQVQAFDRSGSKLLDTGSLSAVDSQINTSTGTVNLKATFPNTSLALFPNQFVNANLRIEVLKDAVAMPTAGIQRGSKGTFAYVVKADNTVAMTPVKLGPNDGQWAAVQSGLAAGDRVVIDGADKLRDGTPVSVSTE